MGRTYYSRNRPPKTFDVNVAGTQILDCLHAEIGVGYFIMGKGEWATKMAKFIYTKELAIKSAKALKAMDEERIKKIYKQTKKFFGGDLNEFKQFIKDWADFLEKSNGCRAD